MRNPLLCSLLLFILPLLNSGCKKDADQSSGSLAGSWELRATSGAMTPGQTIYAPGNGNILAFSGSTYKIYQSGVLVKSGQFSVVQDTTVTESVCLVLPKGEYTNRIIYSDSATIKIFYQVEGNKLTFYSGCYAYDGGHSEVYAMSPIFENGNTAN
jgi:hypothetical protein